MTEDEIVGYVTKTPENSNPAVLRGMLGQLASGGAKVADHLVHFTLTFMEDEGTYEITDFDLSSNEVDSSTGESYLAVVKIVDSDGYLSQTKMADFDSDIFEFFVFTPANTEAPNLTWFRIRPDYDNDTWNLDITIYKVTVEAVTP